MKRELIVLYDFDVVACLGSRPRTFKSEDGTKYQSAESDSLFIAANDYDGQPVKHEIYIHSLVLHRSRNFDDKLNELCERDVDTLFDYICNVNARVEIEPIDF